MAAPFFQGTFHDSKAQYSGFIVLSLMLILPSVFPDKIGWLTCFIPLPVFYYLVSFGKRRASILIRNGILLAACCALFFDSLPMLLFSFTLVPLGITLSYGVFNRKSPVTAGFMGFVVLALTLFLYWFGLALLFQTNPYTTLLVELEKGLINGLLLYEESAELAPETMESIRRAVELLRVYIPQILPAVMVSALLGIVWLNLLIGNWLLIKKDPELTPWPQYNEWKLPDPLVWVVVMSGVFFLLLPQPLNIFGLNGLIVCSTVYFFQGLAIAASFFNKWSVPKLIRLLIYALIFIQTYGIIVLSFLGLVDVWADFRKLEQPGDNQNSSV